MKFNIQFSEMRIWKIEKFPKCHLKYLWHFCDMAGIGFNCGSLLSVKAMYFLQYSYMNEQLMFLVYYKEMSSKEINSKIDNYIKITNF